jgi:hypothetical protein
MKKAQGVMKRALGGCIISVTMSKRDRRLKEEIKKCKETNRSLNDFFSTRGVLDIFF